MGSEPRRPSISSNAPNRWEKKRICQPKEKIWHWKSLYEQIRCLFELTFRISATKSFGSDDYP
jgi:hypothetical protein